LGLRVVNDEPQDPDGPALLIWPDNRKAFSVYDGMKTQWVSGINGRECLRYEALPTVIKALGFKKSVLQEVFDDLRLMEGAALELFAKQSTS
jgi:hypothetical protein